MVVQCLDGEVSTLVGCLLGNGAEEGLERPLGPCRCSGGMAELGRPTISRGLKTVRTTGVIQARIARAARRTPTRPSSGCWRPAGNRGADPLHHQLLVDQMAGGEGVGEEVVGEGVGGERARRARPRRWGWPRPGCACRRSPARGNLSQVALLSALVVGSVMPSTEGGREVCVVLVGQDEVAPAGGRVPRPVVDAVRSAGTALVVAGVLRRRGP